MPKKVESEEKLCLFLLSQCKWKIFILDIKCRSHGWHPLKDDTSSDNESLCDIGLTLSIFDNFWCGMFPFPGKNI